MQKVIVLVLAFLPLLWVRNPIEINKVGSFTLEDFLFHFMFVVEFLENEEYLSIGNSRENEACQNWRKNRQDLKFSVKRFCVQCSEFSSVENLVKMKRVKIGGKTDKI